MYCPDCGRKNRPSANFCLTCGYKLSKSAPPARRKASVSAKKPPSKPVVKKAKPKPAPKPKPALSVKPASSTTLAPPPAKRGLLPVGSVLDRRYEVQQHIATGGMGAIYRGEDTRLKTQVAIKEMLDFFHSHDERKYAIQRFREEALLLADLRHPNVPRVTDNFIENNRYYLIMDFVEGKSTEKIIQENQGAGLPLKDVAGWAVQICDVLYYLHTRTPPIIYRDMKPSNIMITAGNKVMLVDFGIARHFTPRRPGTMIGTHGYAPPEQYKGNTEPRSDLYALASTLHHLITGRDPTRAVPFKFKPVRELRGACSHKLEAVLKKALQNRVELRYTNADEMKKAFMETPEYSGAVENPATAPAPSMPPPPVYKQKSRPRSSIDAQNHFTRAKNLAEVGRFKRAKKELEKALKLSPDYPEAHSLMGFVKTRLGKPKDALPHLNQAIALNPGSATAHFYMGKAYARMGKIADSQKEFKIASRLDPQMFRKRNQGFLERLIDSLLS